MTCSFAGSSPPPRRDRPLQLGEDVALEGAGAGGGDRGVEGFVGERGGAADMGDLGGALDGAELADEERGVGQRREAVEGVGEAAALGGGQPVGLPLDTKLPAGEVKLGEDPAQVALGRGALGVDPHPHVGDQRGEAGLQAVGGAGDEREAAVRGWKTSAWKCT